MKVNKLIISLFVILLGLLFIFPSLFNKNLSNINYSSTKKGLPLILIPGTSSDEDRFDYFIHNIMKDTGGSDVLKIEVQKDGSLKWKSSLKKNSHNPLIVISFYDSSEKGVDKQAEWTETAMKKAHQLYSFDSYNALGHSNGGLVWTIYLEKIAQKSTSQMKTLITLGTPYNYLDSNANPYPNSSSLTETDMLRRMINKKGKIPHSLRMISLAGNYKNNGDGVVPLSSALSSSKIYKNQAKSYGEKIFYGANARHGKLIENDQIIDYISDKIY